MTNPTPRWWMRLQWRAHRLLWDLSRGHLGRRAMGMPVLELVTSGHITGRPRRILIAYLDTPSGPAIAGTNAGSGSEPAWAANLRADPKARMRVSGEWRQVRARFLGGSEHDRMWVGFVEASGAYAGYEEMLQRPIPIVVLEETG